MFWILKFNFLSSHQHCNKNLAQSWRNNLLPKKRTTTSLCDGTTPVWCNIQELEQYRNPVLQVLPSSFALRCSPQNLSDGDLNAREWAASLLLATPPGSASACLDAAARNLRRLRHLSQGDCQGRYVRCSSKVHKMTYQWC